MTIFFSILFGIIIYIVGSGATHGYGQHRWPIKMVRGYYETVDENGATRTSAAVLWPFYWIFVWPFTKTNETVFDHIEKEAALQVAKNKSRIEDIRATREQLEASNKELEDAQVSLEKELRMEA
jgi:hypothetical protein